MTALTASVNRPANMEPTGVNLPPILGKASTQYWNNGLLMRDSSGDVVPATDAAGAEIYGLSTTERLTGASPASPDDDIHASTGVIIRIAQDGNIATTDVGSNAFVLDDNTVSNGATVTNNLKAGKILKRYSASEVLLWLGVFAATDA